MKAKFFINELPVLDADIESVFSWGVTFKISTEHNQLSAIAQEVIKNDGTMCSCGDAMSFSVKREIVSDIIFS